MNEQGPITEVRDLVMVYGGGTRALDGITFQVAPGELFGFLGPNGAGKTTAIRILATLLRATSGTARVAGFDVAAHPHEARRRLGLAMQTPALGTALLSMAILGAILQVAILWSFHRLDR